MLNFDLHCHSTVSDGTLSPEALAARAHANGVDVLAMTDHDEVAGIAQARTAAATLGLSYVSGVEISITWAGQTVHIVGLHIDETNQALIDGLAGIRRSREARAREMAAQLEAAGVQGAFEGARRFVGTSNLISRTHFARYILALGLCKNISEVFADYLGENKPGFVPQQWCTLSDALQWIGGAGGIAVIAHPGRYKFSDMAFDALFSEFKDKGGTAIEVVTGSHTPDQYDVYAKVANHYGFLASRGSDFHSPGESRVDLGALPPLPDNVTPVWHDWPAT